VCQQPLKCQRCQILCSIVISASITDVIEKPENTENNMANCGLYLFDESVFDFIKRTKKSERGEYEITDSLRLMIKEGLVEPPFHFGIVLNVPGALRYDSQALGFFTQRLPKDAMFTVMGIGGRASLQAVYGALAFGGHIRQGLEDNIYYSKGVVAESNAQLVERAARVAKEMGCDIATPDDVRELLAL